MGNQFLGRADTATKLETPRTIFSQSFDGTTSVSGQALVYGAAVDVSRYINGALQVREAGLVANTQTGSKFAPRIGFHWGNVSGANIILNSSGSFEFTSGSDERYVDVYAKTFIGALQGNATSATTATTATSANKWTTARTITLSGNASGSVSLDGSANVALNITNHYATGSDSANWLEVPDTREVNVGPKDLKRSVRFEFKRHSAISDPYGNDTYNGLMSAAFYPDATGGNRYQIAFGSDMGTIPYLSMRTNTGGATAWGSWTLLPTMNQANGYWGFKFPTNNTYLRMPPNGLLPSESVSTGIGYVGTSSWPFLAMHAKTFYGNLSGNATTATTATSATSATNATNATNATYASMVNGIYTGSGGNQPPSYIPRGKVRFNMMRGLTGISSDTFSGYCDCMLMDTYTGGDVPIVTGFGIARVSGNPRAWIFNGAQGGTGWSKYTELITGVNIASQSVAYSTNSGQLGGIAAASYINTSDTLILRGVV